MMMAAWDHVLSPEIMNRGSRRSDPSMPLHNLPTLMEELQRPAFERTISWRRSHLDNGDMDGAAAAWATPCISIEFQGHRTRQATGYQTHHTFRCCNDPGHQHHARISDDGGRSPVFSPDSWIGGKEGDPKIPVDNLPTRMGATKCSRGHVTAPPATACACTAIRGGTNSLFPLPQSRLRRH